MLQSDERQYTLQELATAAGVSIRTIRYYIGEGLLPAPVGSGPQSHYTQSHFNRLRAIGLLKDRYLPLREIRKSHSGLDDEEIERIIATHEGTAEPSPLDADVEGAPAMPAAAPLRISEAPDAMYDALSYIDTALERGQARREVRRGAIREERRVDRGERDVWRKIEVAEGVEILVRDDLYRRRREQIDWLVDWAKKVVD